MRNHDKRLRQLIAEQAADWYVSHRDGAMSATQTHEFMEWLRASPSHVAEYLSVAGIARDITQATRRDPATVPELLAIINAEGSAIPLDPAKIAMSNASLGTPRMRRIGGWRMALAASVLLLLSAGFAWQYTTMGGQTFATRHGEQRTLQLPDNTVVRLNSDSSIVVRFDGHRRDVEVRRGQAYFEVAKDPARPFSVRAGEYRIEDVGTTFDVYLQKAATTITVVEGSVRVWDRSIPSPASISRSVPSAVHPLAVLPAGMQASIASSGRVAQRPVVDVHRATAWIDEKIVFDAEPIAAVAAQFNRYNRQQIVIEDSLVGTTPISGVFRSYDVPSFVQFLNGLPGVHAEIAGDRIVVASATQPR